MLAYNPLGVPSATSEADNIIKRPPSSLYFQDFSEVPELFSRMKQTASPLAVERPVWPKARPGEGDSEGRRSLDSYLRRNDTLGLSIRLKCYRTYYLGCIYRNQPLAVVGAQNRLEPRTLW